MIFPRLRSRVAGIGRWRAAALVFAAAAIVGAAAIGGSYGDHARAWITELEQSGGASLAALAELRDGDEGPARFAAAAARLAEHGAVVGGLLVTAKGLPLAGFGEQPEYPVTETEVSGSVRRLTPDGARLEVYWPVGELISPYGIVARLDTATISAVRRDYLWRNAILVFLLASLAGVLVLGIWPVAPRDRRGVPRGVSPESLGADVSVVLDRAILALDGGKGTGAWLDPDEGISQSAMQRVFANVEDAAIVFDLAEKRLVNANESACHLLEYPFDDLVRLTVGAIHPYDLDKMVEFIGVVRDLGRARSGELNCLTRSGAVVPVVVAGAILPAERGDFALFVVRRIDERNVVEAALRASEERFRDIAEIGGDWIWEMDADLRFRYLSPRFYEIFPIPSEAVIGKTRNQLAADPAQKENWNRHLDDLRNRRAFRDFTYTATVPSGDVVHVRSSGRPIFAENGDFLGYRGTGTDRTVEFEAEQKAAQAHQLLTDGLESIGEAFVLYDADERLVICNSKYADIFPDAMAGFLRPGTPMEDIIREHARHDVVIDPDAEGEEAIQRRLARHRNPGEPFTRGIDDGRWIRTAEYRVSDGGVVGIHTDVTEQVLREQELDRKSSIQQLTMDSVDQGIAMIDADQRFLVINRRAAEILDLPDELCQPGVHITEQFRFLAERGEYGPGDIGEIVRERLRSAMERTPRQYQRERPDGRVIEISSIPLANGWRVSTYTDITERARASEAEKASEQRLAGILGISDDAIISVDSDQRIIMFNQGAEKIFGYRQQDVLGRPLLRLMPEWARANHGDQVEAFESSGKVSREMKERGRIWGLRKDGKEFPAEASISVLETADQNIFTVILRDVSERVKTEQEREFLLEEIHQAQKMDAVGTLAAGIAHDFNNLLVSILGYTDLGIDDLGEDHPVSANLMQVRKAGLRASELVQQILSLSRDQEQTRKPVCLAEVVREALDLIRATLPSSVEIRDSITKGSTEVLASETAVHQIVVNLCVNAGQAIGTEHGVVELRLEDIEVDDRLVRQINSQASGNGANGAGAGDRQILLWGDLPAGPYVRVSVRDTGCGMDKSTMSRIFEPFFTSRQVGEGTGLGLFAVHGIVVAHDGAIVVESAIDDGTEFQIYLPRLAGEADSEHMGRSEAIGGTERVLFVDDEPDLVGLAKRVLGRLGYVVEGATSGEAALSKFRASPDAWDLVVTDHAMPRLSGEDLAREILAIRNNVPIILCSGYSDAIDEERAKTIGFRDYVKKPTVGNELAAAVRRVLDAG